MGRPPKNPPKEAKLKTLIEDLGKAGCMMMWKGHTPFFRSGAGRKTTKLWQVWAGAVDSMRRTRWLNFDSETNQYLGSIEETEVKMLAILSGDRSDGLIAGDPKEIIHETHGDDEGLTRQGAARLIYEYWCNDHAKLLQDALAELKRVREKRKLLYGFNTGSAAAGIVAATISSRLVRQTGFLAGSYVPRRNLLEQALTSIVEAHSKEPVSGSVALIGGGGFGKSTLATAAVRSLAESRQFDHILRTSVGKDRTNVSEAIVDWIEAVSTPDRRPAFSDPEAAGEALANVIGNQSCLFVVDDVWSEAQARPFMIGCPRSVRLFTSRVPGALADCKQIFVGEMDPHEAFLLLSHNITLSSSDFNAAQELAHDLFYWPQLLCIANRSILFKVQQGHDARGAFLSYQDTLHRKGLRGLDPRDEPDRTKAIKICFEPSLENFSPDEISRLWELSVFSEDTIIPFDIVFSLWQTTGGIDHFESDRILRRFYDVSLLQVLDYRLRVVALHDNVIAFLREEAGQELVRCTHSTVCNCLLEEAGGKYNNMPSSNHYGWNNLLLHLHAAGRGFEADSLVKNYSWIRAFVRVSDIQSLVKCLDFPSEDVAANEIRRALAFSVSSLAANPKELARQVYGRLGRSRNTEVASFVAEALSDPEIQPKPRWPNLLSPEDGFQTPVGHSGTVRCAAFSPDGSRIATASWDRTGAIWDWASRSLIATLRGHTSQVQSIDWSDDGQLVVTASGAGDQSVRVWDALTGKELATLGRHDLRVRNAIFMPGEYKVVSVSHDRTVMIWDFRTHTQRRLPYIHPCPILTASVSPDLSALLTASQDCNLRIIDLETGELKREVVAHEKWLKSAHYCRNRPLLVTASDDGMVTIWSTENLTPIGHLGPFDNGARSARFSADGTRLVVANSRVATTFDVSDPSRPFEISCMVGHTGHVLGAVFSPCGTRIATCSHDHTARVWDTLSGRPLARLGDSVMRVRTISASADGKIIAASHDDGSILLYHSSDGRTTKRGPHLTDVQALAFSRMGMRLFFADKDGNIRSQVVNSRGEAEGFSAHDDRVNCIKLSADDKLLVTASDDRTARIFALDPVPRLIQTLTHEQAVKCADISSCGRFIATAADDQYVRVWQVGENKPFAELQRFDGAALSVAIHPDARSYAACSSDMSIRIGFLDHRAPETLQLHKGSVTAVQYSADGRFLISASQDRTIAIYDLSRRALLTSVELDAPVSALAIGHGFILAGDSLGRVHLIELQRSWVQRVAPNGREGY